MTDSMVFGLNNWEDGLSSTEMIKAVGIKNFRGKIRNSVFKMINLRYFLN